MSSDTHAFREATIPAAARFALELAAWIVIFLAWGWPALVIAVAALTLFTVPGDRHAPLVRIPGPLRIALEIAVAAAGILGAREVWGGIAAVALGVAYLILWTLAPRRWVWMWGQ